MADIRTAKSFIVKLWAFLTFAAKIKMPRDKEGTSIPSFSFDLRFSPEGNDVDDDEFEKGRFLH